MIDWLFGLLTPAQWEAWRGWLTTLGGLVALFVATSTYIRNGRIKREEQARLVYSKLIAVNLEETGATFPLKSAEAGRGEIVQGAAEIVRNPDPISDDKWLGRALHPVLRSKVLIHNGSKELIGPARLQLVNGATKHVWDDFSIQVDTIDPESDFVVDIIWRNEFHPGLPSLTTTVIFRDASGQWWRRHRSEPIERVHDDPENAGPTPKERLGIREYQEAIGIPEGDRVQELRVTPRVRFYRLLRTLAGKSPLP